MNAIRTILVPTDLAEKSREVFRLACSIARDHQARVVVLHVMPRPPLPEVPPSPLARERVRHTEADWEAYKWEMEKKLRSLHAPGDEVAIEHVIKQGDRAAAILHTAVEIGCDLIVMETHSKSPEETRILGSVAAEVMRRPPCPVFMLRFPPK